MKKGTINISDLFTKYNCTNCQDDITGIWVHCAECTAFDLCLQCFAAGAEIGQHSNNHAYQFMDTGTAILSIFRGKGSWSAREELRLLDAIEKYGFGNWEDISKHIETKNAEDSKEEYVNKYLNGTIGRHTWIPAQSQRPQLIDHTDEDNGPLGANAIQNLPPLDITPEECVQLGYMVNRDGYEREYDPTAEQLISSLTLNADDGEPDYLLKLAHVDMYTRRLRERVRRKRIVRDYQLVANFFRNKNQTTAGLSREQREFRDRFRVFAQFFSSNEYERLLASLEREKELRTRLAELHRYRWNGLTKIDECKHFEQHAAVAQQWDTGPHGQGKTDNPIIGSQPESSSLSPHNKKLELTNEDAARSSSTGRKHTHHTEDPTCSGALLHNKNCLDSSRGSSGHMTNAQTTAMIPTTTIVMKRNSSSSPTPAAVGVGDTEKHIQKKQENVITNQVLHQNQDQQLELSQQRPPQQERNQKQQEDSTDHPSEMSSILRIQLEELKHLPQPLGQNLLSSNEIQLCNSLNLPPTSYFTLKTVFLSGNPSPSDLSPVENSVKRYLIKAGWLSH